MTSPLATLLAAIRNGRQVCDEKLRRAWEAEMVPGVLFEAAGMLGRRSDAANAWGMADPETCVCDLENSHTVLGCVCPACCDAIRAAVRPPTWAELTATKGEEGR